MVNKNEKEEKPDGRVNLGRRREEALFPAAPPLSELPEDYAEALNGIKNSIQQVLTGSNLSLNSIGSAISSKVLMTSLELYLQMQTALSV